MTNETPHTHDEPAPIRVPPTAAKELKTTFNPTWLIKITIMFLAFAAFGSWALYDATLAYPKRGQSHAEYAEWKYLEALDDADAEDASLFPGGASVVNPADELERLDDRDTRAANAEAINDSASHRHLRATMEEARREWLTALQRIGHMTPEYTTYDDRSTVRTRLDELAAEWQTKANIPAPLASYDIPSQWIIMAVCYALAGYMLLLFLKTAVRQYRYDPAAMRLTLPGGASLTPNDLADVDKRKWDKFIVFLRIKESHDTLGGKELRIDTYRLARLEGWILEMEAVAFPDRAEKPAEADRDVDDATAVPA
ncbi:MAG: hypothetical protein CMJ31_12505 [Phycisphaerae bacterium]|nr:hypothetical protein [Phycisphaerae bacterium]